MKKTGNSFFAENSFQSYNPNMGNGAPYQSASNYFYQGPIPNNYNTNTLSNDIETRIAKIERQINRIEYRLSKLENATNIIATDDIENSNTNMYML